MNIKEEPEPVKGSYTYREDMAMKKIAEVLEEILGEFHGEENCQIREGIANYTLGYMGVSFGLHVKR